MKIANISLEDFRFGPPVEPIEDICSVYLAEFADCYRAYRASLARAYKQWQRDKDLAAYSQRAAILDHDFDACIESLGSLYFSASGDKLW